MTITVNQLSVPSGSTTASKPAGKLHLRGDGRQGVRSKAYSPPVFKDKYEEVRPCPPRDKCSADPVRGGTKKNGFARHSESFPNWATMKVSRDTSPSGTPSTRSTFR